MTAPARNAGSMRRALDTIKQRRARWERDQAIRRNADGLPDALLAKLHGVSVSTLRDIRAGRRRRK